MLNSNNIKNLRDVFSKHHYIMTTSELKAEKLYYVNIQQLIAEGLIEKVKQGYYHWIDEIDNNEVLIINKLFPDAILCMETALFYYGYTDKKPAEWNIAINKNVSRQRAKIDYPFVKEYRMEPALLLVGETNGKIDFTEVRIYDRDRTICDLLRNINKMDIELFNKAVQNYVKDSEKNISNLMQYAKKLRVRKKVKDLIEVWL